MAVKWIICDIDGCISPEESIPWDLEPFWQFARISQEASAGRNTLAPLALCSGRPQPYVEVLMKILDIRAPAICENGAVLYSLSNNWARYGPGVTEQKIQGLRAVRTFIETKILPSEPGVLMQFGKEAQLSLFSEHPEVFEPIKRQVEEFTKKTGGPTLLITDSHYYLNISLAGVDKGTTLEKLLGELGVNKEELAGIGDTEGDLPIRDKVGFFSCPANAREGIKAVADYVSPYPLLRGTLDILQRPEVRLC